LQNLCDDLQNFDLPKRFPPAQSATGAKKKRMTMKQIMKKAQQIGMRGSFTFDKIVKIVGHEAAQDFQVRQLKRKLMLLQYCNS